MNINGLIGSLQSGVAQGVLWGIMVLGVYITYKLLDIADLTVDGSFTLGGCVTTVAILAGIHPVPATLMGMGAGFLAGAVTGILHPGRNSDPDRPLVHQPADHGRKG